MCNGVLRNDLQLNANLIIQELVDEDVTKMTMMIDATAPHVEELKILSHERRRL
jgi:hypothetical protein